MSARTVTIEDVGKAAGVSRQTVSRVINGSPNVSAAARERVEAAIAELGYVPNAAARRMGGGRSSILLAVLDAKLVAEGESDTVTGLPIEAMLIEGMRACSAQGYHLLFEQIDASGAQAPHALSRVLMETAADGVILLPPLERNATLAAMLEKRGLPHATLGEYEAFGRKAPGLDDLGQGEAAAAHLIERGHKQIAFIAGRTDRRQSKERLDGYRRALVKAGSRAHRHFACEKPLDFMGALELVRSWLVPTIRPTAIIAETAEIALAIAQVARELNRVVPHDLSLITLEDKPSLSCVEPAISALAHDYSGLFANACATLMQAAGGAGNQADDADDPRPDESGPTYHLIDRASVAKAPRAV